MRRLAGAALFLLALGMPGFAAPPVPHRIMSLKLCTDELLMDLVPPSRIASVTYLSRETAALRLWPQAAGIPINHNSAEEVLAARPDLILTDEFTAPAMRALLAESGARVVEVPAARSFDDIRRVTRLVADAVGARPRAEALLAHMDAVLHRLAPPHRAIRVAGWGGGGFLPGQGTLFDTVLAAAGGTNIAGRDGRYADVEGLIAARPDVLAYGDDYNGTPSLRTDQDTHPLLLTLFANRRVTYPSALLNCGLPETADAALALQGALAAAMRHPGGAP